MKRILSNSLECFIAILRVDGIEPVDSRSVKMRSILGEI